MLINIKMVSHNAQMPSRGSNAAAGWDLYSANSEPVIIPAGYTVKIGTGIAAEIPDGYFGALYARSGMASSKGLAPANKVGIIDSDYRGEIIVPLHNHGNEMQIVEPGTRIAQLVVMPYLPIDFNVVENLNTTNRGEGGFGSTGTK